MKHLWYAVFMLLLMPSLLKAEVQMKSFHTDFWANDAHYVLGALGREPALTKSLQAQIKALEDRPGPKESRLPRGSWQSEYDKPEFADYLRDPLGK